MGGQLLNVAGEGGVSNVLSALCAAAVAAAAAALPILFLYACLVYCNTTSGISLVEHLEMEECIWKVGWAIVS